MTTIKNHRGYTLTDTVIEDGFVPLPPPKKLNTNTCPNVKVPSMLSKFEGTLKLIL
jgi:hypothetical protein